MRGTTRVQETTHGCRRAHDVAGGHTQGYRKAHDIAARVQEGTRLTIVYEGARLCTREYEEAAQDEDAAGRTRAQGVTPRCRRAQGYRSTH